MKDEGTRWSALRSRPRAAIQAARARIRASPRRAAASVTLIVTVAFSVWSLIDGLLNSSNQGLLDPSSLTVVKLLHVLQTTDGYMNKAGWREQDGTFVPSASAGKRGWRGWRFFKAVGRKTVPTRLTGILFRPVRFVGRRVLLPVVRSPARLVASPFRALGRRLRRRREKRQTQLQQSENVTAAPVAIPNKIVDFTRSLSKTPRNKACGSVREVHQIGAVFPGVDPVFLMEVMTNPMYGIQWNPAIRSIVLRQHRRVGANAALLDVFSEAALTDGLWRNPAKLSRSTSNEYDVTAQVSEIPLPMAIVKLAGGPRYSADFVAARYDCQARRGFTVGTSIGADQVAEAAGVAKAQDLCVSAMMISPYEGAFNGSRIHLVSHFDPKIPSQTLRSLINHQLPGSIKLLYSALHKKALEVQAAGRHPFVDC